jgi:ATP-binding cassette subfamily C protein
LNLSTSLKKLTAFQQKKTSRVTYQWQTLLELAKLHKKSLIKANTIAVLAVIASVPVPLLMPLLVDEVLLNQPGFAVHGMQQIFPPDWQGPVLYIFALLLLTLLLRGASLVFNVIQTRLFTLTAKDITFQIRRDLLKRLQYISMADFETVGSGTVASHFITDLETIDHFIGSTISAPPPFYCGCTGSWLFLSCFLTR